MKYTNRIDCHSHSAYSPDSQTPAAEMCARALELGLTAYAITDHCECDFFDPAHPIVQPKKSVPIAAREEDPSDEEQFNYAKTTAQSLKTVTELKAAYAGKLELLAGVEIGQAMQNLEAAEQVTAKPYDLIIGSLHRAAGLPDYYFIDYAQLDSHDLLELLRDYYEELYRTACWNKFDTLGHLTYPLRYIVGDFGIPVDIHQCDDIIEQILKTLAQNGKALEINTSGLRQKLGHTMPEVPYVKWFRELGGEFITIGSDAHNARDLGAGIEQGMERAYKAGFRHITYFKQRKPVLLPLL